MTLTRRYIKTKNAYKVTFKLTSPDIPDGSEIRLLGDFNNWEWSKAPALKKVKGEYQAKIELEAGETFEYRYLIDQQYWLNDTCADDYVPSSFAGVHNCVVTLADYDMDYKEPKEIDFTEIEGIGPAISKLILQAGILSFEKLAKTKVSDLYLILKSGGNRFRIHDPSMWPVQAKEIVLKK